MKATRIVSRPKYKLVIIEMPPKQASELSTTCYNLSQNGHIAQQEKNVLFTLFTALETRWAYPAQEEDNDDC